MTYGKAISILESKAQETVEASVMLEAIDKILSMATINAVNKNALMNAVRFLRNHVNELLKEQEPRVLTLEEVTGGGECWIESKNGACGYCDCYLCEGREAVEVWRCMEQQPSYVPWFTYGKVWRCWTARPTDEQRKAVKWE